LFLFFSHGLAGVEDNSGFKSYAVTAVHFHPLYEADIGSLRAYHYYFTSLYLSSFGHHSPDLLIHPLSLDIRKFGLQRACSW
jgi:hypothetical protein